MFSTHLLVEIIIYLTTLLMNPTHGVKSENTTDTVESWAKVIEEGLTNAFTYEVPTNANMYEPTDDKVIEFGSYDFVIVGGGTTGAIVARRLSENDNSTVLLLEAGEWANSPFLQIIAYSFINTHSEYNWGYKSVPQTTACLGLVNQSCSAPQGRGLGGSSLFNGALYNHADPAVFKKWVDITKDMSWSYKNILPFYKKSESFHHRNLWTHIDKDYHGYEGPLNVEQSLPPDELAGAFLAANEELGVTVADANGPYSQVASIMQLYSKNGKRQDTAAAFLKPVLQRPNLRILTGAFVTKIEIDRNTKVAKGVTFSQRGKMYYTEAKKEVILSAGAFSSPMILMLSGIGPKKHLKEKGIPVYADLEVGSNLTDDVALKCLFTLGNIYTPAQTEKEKIEDFIHGIGSLTSLSTSQGFGWYKSSLNKNDNVSDVELIVQIGAPSALEVKVNNWKNETYQALWGNATRAVQIHAVLVNPQSRGTVRLRSNSPYDYPLIDFNYLSDPENKDIAVMYEAIKFIFKLLKTEPFQKFETKYEERPIPECSNEKFLSKRYWKCFIRHTSMSAYHATGTCPMGSDPREGAVVDSSLKVFGIYNLRIADCSVIPTTTARHPSGTCMMFGEKLSTIIKAQYF